MSLLPWAGQRLTLRCARSHLSHLRRRLAAALPLVVANCLAPKLFCRGIDATTVILVAFNTFWLSSFKVRWQFVLFPFGGKALPTGRQAACTSYAVGVGVSAGPIAHLFPAATRSGAQALAWAVNRGPLSDASLTTPQFIVVYMAPLTQQQSELRVLDARNCTQRRPVLGRRL